MREGLFLSQQLSRMSECDLWHTAQGTCTNYLCQSPRVVSMTHSKKTHQFCGTSPLCKPQSSSSDWNEMLQLLPPPGKLSPAFRKPASTGSASWGRGRRVSHGLSIKGCTPTDSSTLCASWIMIIKKLQAFEKLFRGNSIGWLLERCVLVEERKQLQHRNDPYDWVQLHCFTGRLNKAVWMWRAYTGIRLKSE